MMPDLWITIVFAALGVVLGGAFVTVGVMLQLWCWDYVKRDRSRCR